MCGKRQKRKPHNGLRIVQKIPPIYVSGVNNRKMPLIQMATT